MFRCGKDLVGGPAVRREACDAGADADRVAIDRRQGRYAVDDPACDGQPGRSGRNEHELVAAVSSDCVHEADGLREDRGDRPEDIVAGLMTCVFVRRLEVIDIEQRYGDLASLTPCPRKLQLQYATEGALVGEPRERIGVRHPLEPL